MSVYGLNKHWLEWWWKQLTSIEKQLLGEVQREGEYIQ